MPTQAENYRLQYYYDRGNVLEERAGGTLQLQRCNAPMWPGAMQLVEVCSRYELDYVRGAHAGAVDTRARCEIARDVVARGLDVFGRDFQAVARAIMLARMFQRATSAS